MIAGHEQIHTLHIEAHLPPDDALYRIRDAASAAAAARLPRGTVVTLAVPGMDPGAAAHYESNINASLGECGCRLSAVFLVMAVCAATVIDVLQWSFIRNRHEAPTSRSRDSSAIQPGMS